ncbi:alpha/beta hydrolase family protein [Nocardia sp. NPDC057227]|uniref:alpha/beta hydrolase family protein n=1 Tax=Nocardia sp. NPDC057227 TaxID=3346056 RepID=UPI003633D9C9
MPITRRRSRWLYAVVGIVLMLGTQAQAHADPASPAAPASPPARDRMQVADEPCAVAVRQLPNPEMPAQPIFVYEPTGAAEAPLTGGRCESAARPAVVIAHGFSASDPGAYLGLIQHLVRAGNVVLYPTYPLGTTVQQFEDSYRRFDAGVVAALATTRADTSRIGFWGHSFGGGMVPYLAQQAGARGWGSRGLWISMVAQAYSQLVGTGQVEVPANTRAMTIAFDQDNAADARLGIDIFRSLTVPADQKWHITVRADAHGQPALASDHTTPASFGPAGEDTYDFLLYRYADQLEGCAIGRIGCDLDLSTVGDWSDGTPIAPALVGADPVDVGPAPALVADCDGGIAGGPPIATVGEQPLLGGINPRWQNCGPTHR